jgi:hypothetical protein
MRMSKTYLSISFVSFALAGCIQPGTSRTVSSAAGEEVAVAKEIQPAPTCPGRDFPSFLKAFAANPNLREQYTMPTVLVVDYVDPAGGGGDSDETKVIKVPRSEYRQFTLRYSNGGFHHASSDETVDPGVLEIKIKHESADFLVAYTYGLSEGNSWLFRFHDHCWYLAEDPEAPTE